MKLEQRVTSAILTAVQELAPENRNGFLFALAISDMIRAGYSKERLITEVLQALDIAWENRLLATGGIDPIQASS